MMPEDFSHRLLQSGIMEKPPLFLKLWVWMLLQAVNGQFSTSLESMCDAMAYKVGFRVVRPSKKEIRGAVDFLAKADIIGPTKGKHGIQITICKNDSNKDRQTCEGHGKPTGTEKPLPEQPNNAYPYHAYLRRF